MSRVRRILVGCLLLCCVPAAGQTVRPNILLLVAEDLSPRIGAYGDDVAHTPNIDALAASGTRYTNAFTTAGVCAPSRAALMTGQHQIAFGGHHMRTSTGPLGEYYAQPDPQVRAFSELLRQHGYFTFTDSKLDYQFSGISAGSGPFTIWDMEGAADEAWRERDAGQPFFGMINFLETHESGVMRPAGTPHSPVHAAMQKMRARINTAVEQRTDPAVVELPPYYPDLPEVRADIARHYDNVAAMDARVGRIVQALQQDGLLENTIIVWTSDHGDGLPRAKRELYDAGLHVPLIVRHPRQAPAVQDRLVSFVDLAPTVLRWAQVPLPPWLHGQSIEAPSLRRYVFAARDRIDEVQDRQRAVRDSRYKLIRSWHPEVPGGHVLAYRDNLDMVRAWRAAYERGELSAAQRRWFEPAGEYQLFDTRQDPHELHNLAASAEHQTVLQRLQDALRAHLQRVGDAGEIAEHVLRATYLDNGAVPRTPTPEVDVIAGRLQLKSPIGASIGYRLPGQSRWRLYTEPVPVQRLEAKSVRYGWRESEVVPFSPPD